ncbi:MAG: alanine racemase [Acidimicrobiaceae bacterium]|nr:alanine racemase [Acidimicrobiaceae bacterium]
MTLRLNVQSMAWSRQIDDVATSIGDIVPVVKGNGYGFGRLALMPYAASLGNEIAVGTIFEAHDVPESRTAIVLTPAGSHLPASLPATAILTVGSVKHVENLRTNSWRGSVIVKLSSRMNRYGAKPDELNDLLNAIKESGLTQIGWSIHPPLDGPTNDHVAEIHAWMSRQSSELPWFVSHIDESGAASLRTAFTGSRIRVRVGTSLWLGDKSMIELSADVLDLHAVQCGDTAGYRNSPITQDGSLVMIGAGTSHGIQILPTELSPFHFHKSRLNLLEPSHMHTSMIFVPTGTRCPEVGDSVDVQQPLTRVYPDYISWD